MSGWEAQPDVIALLVLAGGAYAAGLWRVRRWRARRTAAYAVGLAALAVALLSPLDAGAQTSLHAHMVQRLLIA
ncbi:MAG: cytochrome c oxidase assembly protein, partial [Actinomycetota bacterium]|nr:cytochrome c oxidase assembly protein [Actinomycetota bacterium]